MRKIKKRIFSALYLAAALSLTSCNKDNKENKVKTIKELTATYEQIQKDKEEEIKEAKRKLDRKFIESLSDNEDSFYDINIELEGARLVHNRSFDTLEISKEDKDNDEFTEDFYHKLNLIINEFEVEEIEFENWENEIDFSKLDFKNIKSLRFSDFSGIFDSTKLNLENINTLHLDSSKAIFDFSGITSKIESLSFSNTPINIVKNVFSNCNLEDVYVEWSESKKAKKLKPLLEYLTKNDIMIETFNIYSDKNITPEEFDLIGKLNACDINIEAKYTNNPINLDLALNDNIRSIDFDIRNYKDYDIKNSEIGNVKIKSNNKDLSLRFSHMNITDNTHFSVPNSSLVNFNLLTCKSIRAFEDLKNVKDLIFKATNGPGPMADNEGRIWYYKDKNEKYLDIETGEPAKLIHDYKEMLKKLSYYYKLSKLRDKLNVSKNEVQEYYYEKSIGDFVNLVSDDVTILKDGKKTTSYYGTSIIRCIGSIVLQKGDKVVVVDNMEDYEKYKYKNFKVKGYNLINEYSLNKNGTLTPELCAKDSDIKLVYTPFN